MNNSELTSLWIRITLAFGIGGYKKWEYIDINDPENSVKKLLSDNALQNDHYICKLKSLSNKQVDSVLSACERNEISIITPSDEAYPKRFRHLSDPPSLLFVKGDLKSVADAPSVAIVGARKCCDYSSEVANAFATALAAHHVNIVSGFAEGVDRAAHLGALEAGGTTAAVLGSGIMYDYPKGTLRMKKLISEHGAVISEYLPTTGADKSHFKVRNRLISALADCIVVVEASDRSGALNTANHALEHGKEVFVVPPHDLFNKAFDGQSELLLDGAQLAVHPEQVFEHLVKLRQLG